MSVPIKNPHATLVINTNWHLISYRFVVMADYCSNFEQKRPLCVFEPLQGTLGATYAVYLRLIGELIVDFLLVLIELFSLSVNG